MKTKCTDVGYTVSFTQPLFALFITLEIVLQSGRILRLKRHPQKSGLALSLARQIPIPAVQVAVQMGGQYWSLLSSLLDDAAVLIFTLGVAILAASGRADA